MKVEVRVGEGVHRLLAKDERFKVKIERVPAGTTRDITGIIISIDLSKLIVDESDVRLARFIVDRDTCGAVETMVSQEEFFGIDG